MAGQRRRVVLAIVLAIGFVVAPARSGSDADKPTPPPPPTKATKPSSKEKDTPPPPPDKAAAKTTKTTAPLPLPNATEEVESAAATGATAPVSASIAASTTSAATATSPSPTANTRESLSPAAANTSYTSSASEELATTARWLVRGAAAVLPFANAEALPADFTASGIESVPLVYAVSSATTELANTAAAVAAASPTVTSQTLVVDGPTKKTPKPASGEKPTPAPTPTPKPTLLKEGGNCSSSAQCKDGCCRRTDGSLVDVFGHDGDQADDVIVPTQGTCSKSLGEANEYCGSGCKCRGGFTCYKPKVGVCCQPELCYEKSIVNRQEAYLKRCQSRRGCVMPVQFDDE